MTNKTNEPKMLGSRDSHILLRRLVAQEKPGRVLDAGAGPGSLTKFLYERGFDVRCCDVDPKLYKGPGIPIDKVDLNDKLPYEDSAFDYVTASNVIHRLYNVDGAITEFARVLKTGGKLFLTFNNYSNISKRVRFLFYGSLTSKTNEGRFVQTIDIPAARLRQAIFFPQISKSLERAGLQIEAVKSSRRRFGALLLTPLALFIRLITTILPLHKKESNCLREMNSWALLPGGKHMAIVASKRKM